MIILRKLEMRSIFLEILVTNRGPLEDAYRRGARLEGHGVLLGPRREVDRGLMPIDRHLGTVWALSLVTT